MGIYTEYLERFSSGSFEELSAERKVQLKRISKLRGRDVLVFAADINKNIQQISIDYSDLLPFTDQLSNLKGKQLDLILETPGGSGEVAEDLVKAMRSQFEDVAVIVPGYAKSAGTIMAMAADEILLGPHSGLGPIDAQIFYSREAILGGRASRRHGEDQEGSYGYWEFESGLHTNPTRHIAGRVAERRERLELCRDSGYPMVGPIQIQNLVNSFEQWATGHPRRQGAAGEGNRRSSLRSSLLENAWPVDQDRRS
jgi:hypothetical protein